MNNLDRIIFNKKKFSDLLEEIYTNQKERKTQITSLIKELQPLIKDIGDATLIVPLLKEYLDIGVKNDEHLIKLAQIISKLDQAIKDNGGSFNLSEEEKNQLLSDINKIGKEKEGNE